MMNNRKKIYIITLAIALMTSCEKDPVAPSDVDSAIEISNPLVSLIGQASVNVTTNINGGRDGDIIEKGICWSTTSNPTTSSSKRSGGPGKGALTASITGLTPATSYYARGYFQTKNETVYSDNIPFRTVDYQLATVLVNSISSITLTSALGSGIVTAAGGGAVSSRGLCWSTSSLPTIGNSRTDSGSGVGDFTGNISPLNPGTIYYVRAYATNQAGTAYGAQISFTTVAVKVATVSSVSVSSIAKNSAYVIGTISADGGGTITSKGICYATNTSTPAITTNNYTNNGSGIGTAGGTISGLVNGTNYYVRAYAVNSAGVSYGAVSVFKTL